MASLGIIIGIVVVLLALTVLFKYKEIRHKIGLVIAAAVFLFLVLSVIHIWQNSDKFDLTSFDGVVSAGKIYVAWLGGITNNVIKVSGFAIHQDWSLEQNSSTSKVITNITNSSLRK